MLGRIVLMHIQYLDYLDLLPRNSSTCNCNNSIPLLHKCIVITGACFVAAVYNKCMHLRISLFANSQKYLNIHILLPHLRTNFPSSVSPNEIFYSLRTNIHHNWNQLYGNTGTTRGFPGIIGCGRVRWFKRTTELKRRIVKKPAPKFTGEEDCTL